MNKFRLFFETLESRRLLAAYTIKITDDLDLISSDTEKLIKTAGSYAMTRLNELISWNGVIDTEVRIRPASENPNPNADGLMPSIISASQTTNGWSNDTLQEMITGIDPKPLSPDAGMTIYLGRDGQIRNYGYLVWFDPNPIAYVPAEIPTGSFDYIGVFWHEVFHGIGFYAGAREFSSLTTVINGNDYFIGPNTQQVFGGPLPLAPRQNGWLQDHYGNTALPGNSLNSGLMFQWGNYAGNRLDIGRLDLAVLQDMGIAVKNTAGLPLVDVIDSVAPKNILSNKTISENVPIGTVVGTLTTTKGSSGYQFAFAEGGLDNEAFTIEGNSLKTKVPIDYEKKKSYSIVIRNSDAKGTWTATPFTLVVSKVNEAPTDVQLSKTSLLENSNRNTAVGVLSTTDPDIGNTFSYSLVNGNGSIDNSAFWIDGNTLKTIGSFDFESKSSYSIRIRSTDQGGLSIEKVFMITVVDVNEAPALNTALSPTLGFISEGASESLGLSIADIIVDGSVTDPDGPAIEAIAIAGLNSIMGTWQYSLNNGLTWLSIDASKINSQTEEFALLLGPTARLRLVPFRDFNGFRDDAVTFRAWDNAIGIQGTYTIISSKGDSSPFSHESDFISLNVLAVNDAPSLHTAVGSVTASVGSTGDSGTSALLQPDGKLVVAGYAVFDLNYNFALMRFNPDGSLDNSFGSGGRITTAIGTSDEWATGVILQPDGKIVVAGWVFLGGNYDFALVRYDSNGSLDTSFGIGGKITTPIGSSHDVATCLALQPDGKIVVGGYATIGGNYDFALIRYNTNGSLDGTFGTGGKVTSPISQGNDIIWGLAIQPDGKIVVGGNSLISANECIALARYNANGSLDTSFGSGGKVTTTIGGIRDTASSLTVQRDGRILVAGTTLNGSQEDFALVRYNLNGSLDYSFGSDGKVITSIGVGKDVASSLAVQADGNIIVAGASFNGTNDDFAMVRYKPNGALDSSFGTGGKVSSAIGIGNDNGLSVVIQPDGQILIAGKSKQGSRDNFALARYNYNGKIDDFFGSIITNASNRTLSYTENANPIALWSQIQVYDPELSKGDFGGAKLTLLRKGGANADDVFTALGTLGDLTQGGNLVVNGTRIGKVATNGNGVLTVDFESNATEILVNSVIQQIAYRNTNDAPPSFVELTLMFSDGNTGSQGSGNALSSTVSVTVSTNNVNDAPIDITLAPNSIAENNLPGADVGVLTTIDPDVVDTFVYSLVNGTGASDNNLFLLDGATLKAIHSFDFEKKSSYSVRIKSTDKAGAFVEKVVAIKVSNVNDAPVAVNDQYSLLINDTSVLHVGSNDLDFNENSDSNSLEILTQPKGGIVQVNRGSIQFQPSRQLLGDDQFNYRIKYSNGTVSNSATVQLNLSEIPTTRNDVVLARRDETVIIDVLANDTFFMSPLNNGSLRITQQTSAGLALVSSGRIQYSPPSKYIGQAKFWYVVGNSLGIYSPPVEVTVNVDGSLFQNRRDPLDVNDDRWINAIDPLTIINELNRRGAGPIENITSPPNPFYDVNGDFFVSAIDALILINHLNRSADGGGSTGEGEQVVENSKRSTLPSQYSIEELGFLEDISQEIQRRRRFRI